MAKKKAPQRLAGAEESCISPEQEAIIQWFRTVKFRKNLLGGVDEAAMWKKLEELYALYEAAIRAERTRYNVLLETSPSKPDGFATSPSRGGKSTGIYAIRFDAFVRYKTSPSKPCGFATPLVGEASQALRSNSTTRLCIVSWIRSQTESKQRSISRLENLKITTPYFSMIVSRSLS